MKTAEEVAEEIREIIKNIGFWTEDRHKVAQALTAFAEERVIARAGRCKWHIGLQLFCSTCCKECETKARAEALEEAAKVVEAEECGCECASPDLDEDQRIYCGMNLAAKIRALKELK